MKVYYSDHRKKNSYHPQKNGLTERLNKSIADMISMYVDDDHNTWDNILPFVTFAYNTALQEMTSFTAFRLIHGREVTPMLDAKMLHDEIDEFTSDAVEYARLAEAAVQLARQRIGRRQITHVRRYNLRQKGVTLQSRDRIGMAACAPPRKF